MKTQLIAAAVAVLATLPLSAQQPSKAPDLVRPNARVIAKLTEIVQVRKQLVERYQTLYDGGDASSENVAGMLMASVDLAEARVNLAQEEGKREALVAALQALVAAHVHRVEMARRKIQASSPNREKVEVERAPVALLEGQVRLLREQK